MSRIFLGLIFLSLPLLSIVAEEDDNVLFWPRDIVNDKGSVVTLYQPQLESFENNILVGRMALSVKVKDKDLIFGALWFSATLITDLDNRIAILDAIDITRSHFPDADPDKVDEFARMIEEEIEGWGIEMSLDRLLASLEVAEVQKVQSNKLNNDPPVILYRSHQAILASIDGEPILLDSEEKDVQYVVNTPYFLVKDTKKEHYYFKAHKWWYSADEITSNWETTTKVPSRIQKLANKVIVDSEMENDSLLKAMKKAPEVIVSTRPAELITTDGEPQFVPIEGTSLLYVDNTEKDIIMDISSQKYYILLAGRWFSSSSLADGRWVFSEPDDLPDEFADIPQESPMSPVRTSVPGTEEAEIAVLEQTIPQTATVDRATASVEVTYDGEPEFKSIKGTSMSYALNTDKSVLLIDGMYYCVDDAIWFESNNPQGPWAVSTERPEGVEDIPAESPVYNVKYVYIYDYTPTVVYVGYTPGYTCSYVYGGVVVYGTGYYYNPWYRHYYYPRYPTYGYGVHYNPYTGWGFSVSISFGRHYPRYGWGPRGYQHGYRQGYSHGYRHGYNRGYARGYYAGQQSGSRNVYNNRSNGVNSSTRGQRQTVQNQTTRNQQSNVSRQNQQPNVNRQNQANTRNNQNVSNNASGRYTRPSNQQNNVYTDRNGNVQRRDQNGNWQNRSNGQWQQQQINRNTQNRQQMNRDANARQQGAQRQSNYNQSRNQNIQRSSGARSGGGIQRGSAGGGRRR